MTVKQYDKVLLKDGRTCTIADILEDGVAYIADVDLPNSDWETVEIRHSDIFKKLESEG